MSTSHLDRKEIKRPDAFLERAGSLFHYINENSGVFLLLLAAMFVAGLGFAFYNNRAEHRSEAANSALFTARKSLGAALEKTPKTDAGWEEKAKASMADLEKVSAEYSGTLGAFEAQLVLGDTYFKRNAPDKAALHYQRAAALAKNRATRALAQHALAYAHENAKQYDLAIEALRQVLASSDKSLRSDALMALARNYELKGDKVKAHEQYELITREFPNTPTARAAEIRKKK